jgi:D-arabinose 1-dehydrogenase-like Zn-dependent alcohol dehydrogenase
MNAARIHRFGSPDVIVVEDITRPVPAMREVLVRVAASGVARTAHEMLGGPHQRGKIILHVAN